MKDDRSLSVKGLLYLCFILQNLVVTPALILCTFIWRRALLIYWLYIYVIYAGKIGPGFGIGALEDLDAEDVDVYDSGSMFTRSCCFASSCLRLPASLDHCSIWFTWSLSLPPLTGGEWIDYLFWIDSLRLSFQLRNSWKWKEMSWTLYML